jgi:hypothetical protein
MRAAGFADAAELEQHSSLAGQVIYYRASR